MKKIFSRLSFTQAPGGNIYEWKDAETGFEISKSGLYVVKIDAVARNARQNRSTDDDDLRISIDGFSFGKYEVHDEKISWKGFGTSASWDGASLKGGTKTVYYFLELDAGQHIIQFFADMKPELRTVEIFEIEDNIFELNALSPPQNIKTESKGIPWLSFVFLGTPPKSILLDVKTKSFKEKGTPDCDNLKVIRNGKVLQNEQAPTSKKYRNFYFSGDIKSAGILSISNESIEDPLAFENSIEFWYDESPEIVNLKIDFFDTEEFLKSLNYLDDLRESVLNAANLSRLYFWSTKRKHSKIFLEHSLKELPENLEFASNHPLVKKVQNDPAYKRILDKVKEKITTGIMDGELWPNDFSDSLSFDSKDLDTSIHGIKKIEFRTVNSSIDCFKVEIKIFDIYDFAKVELPSNIWNLSAKLKAIINNAINAGEGLGIVSNFEIIILINEKIDIN